MPGDGRLPGTGCAHAGNDRGAQGSHGGRDGGRGGGGVREGYAGRWGPDAVDGELLADQRLPQHRKALLQEPDEARLRTGVEEPFQAVAKALGLDDVVDELLDERAHVLLDVLGLPAGQVEQVGQELAALLFGIRLVRVLLLLLLLLGSGGDYHGGGGGCGSWGGGGGGHGGDGMGVGGTTDHGGPVVGRVGGEDDVGGGRGLEGGGRRII